MKTQSRTVGQSRIEGLDLARAIAVFGMIIVNYVATMHLDYSSAGEPAWLSWLPGLIEGRAAPLFITLAGIGVALMTRKAFETGDATSMRLRRRTILKRSLFLFVVGFLHSLVWDADIVHFYAFYMTAGVLLLSASRRALLLAAAISTLAFPMLYVFFDYENGWDFSTLTYVDLWSLEGSVRHIFYNGFHPVFPWVAFLFIGIWLGRGALFDPKSRRRILASALATVVIAQVGTAMIEQMPLSVQDHDIGLLSTLFLIEVLPPTPLYVVSAAASAIAVIVLCLMLSEKVGSRVWLRLLNRTGQMSLTIYVAHIVIGLGALESLGMLYGQTLAFALGYSLFFIVLSVVFANLWRLKWQHGPLEWLMRRLS